MKGRRAAIVPVSLELLRIALHLPPGTTIDNAQFSFERPATLDLRVEHPDLAPIDAGCRLPIITPAIGMRRTFAWFRRIDEIVFLGWGQK